MRHRIGFLTDLTEYSLINSVSVFLVVLVVDGSLVKWRCAPSAGAAGVVHWAHLERKINKIRTKQLLLSFIAWSIKSWSSTPVGRSVLGSKGKVSTWKQNNSSVYYSHHDNPHLGCECHLQLHVGVPGYSPGAISVHALDTVTCRGDLDKQRNWLKVGVSQLHYLDNHNGHLCIRQRIHTRSTSGACMASLELFPALCT